MLARGSTRWACAALAVMWLASSAHAVVLYSSPWRNKTAPTGSLANSGWQWQGQFGDFVGTPIARDYFLTAGHVGGTVGTNLVLGGKSHRTTAMYDDPSSDLRIYKVATPFSSWAPLFRGTSEVGKDAMLFGRGSQRGSEVRVGNVLKGWTWGRQDKILSWGRNRVAGTQTLGSGVGSTLFFNFDRAGLSSEGMISIGDSAGGLFIKDGTTWKLAGVHYAAESSFNRSSGSASFSAAIFDKGGLWQGTRFNTDTSADLPARGYSTRISSRLSWIDGVLRGSVTRTARFAPAPTPVPEPATATLALAAAAVLLRRRRQP